MSTEYITLDDRHKHEDGSRVIADETVTFALFSQVFEIDLTAEHIDELEDDLAKWIACARKGDKLRRHGGQGRIPGKGIKYYEDLRAWATPETCARLGIKIPRQRQDGSWKYDPRTRDAYDEFLKQQTMEVMARSARRMAGGRRE